MSGTSFSFSVGVVNGHPDTSQMKTHLRYEGQDPLKPSLRTSVALSPASVPSALISVAFSDRAWTGV